MEKIDKILQNKIEDLLESIEFTRTTDSTMKSNDYFRLFEDSYEDSDEEDTFEIDLDEVSAENIVEEFTNSIEAGDDEIEMQFEDGTTLILDSLIVKHLLEVCSESELIDAAESSASMYQLLQNVYEEILDVE